MAKDAVRSIVVVDSLLIVTPVVGVLTVVCFVARYLMSSLVLLSPYIPGTKKGLTRRHMFYIGLYREIHKTSSCLKPYGLESYYLVCSIT